MSCTNNKALSSPPRPAGAFEGRGRNASGREGATLDSRGQSPQTPSSGLLWQTQSESSKLVTVHLPLLVLTVHETPQLPIHRGEGPALRGRFALRSQLCH